MLTICQNKFVLLGCLWSLLTQVPTCSTQRTSANQETATNTTSKNKNSTSQLNDILYLNSSYIDVINSTEDTSPQTEPQRKTIGQEDEVKMYQQSVSDRSTAIIVQINKHKAFFVLKSCCS